MNKKFINFEEKFNLFKTVVSLQLNKKIFYGVILLKVQTSIKFL